MVHVFVGRFKWTDEDLSFKDEISDEPFGASLAGAGVLQYDETGYGPEVKVTVEFV